MDKLQRLLARQQSYEPLDGRISGRPEETSEESHASSSDNLHARAIPPSFSLTTYTIFLLLGVAMLWAWNGLMAASPYFQTRFSTSAALLSSFQASELTLASIANLASMLVLTHLQRGANYPRRIVWSLAISSVSFFFLAVSTRGIFAGADAGLYFGFLMLVVLVTSLSTGLLQNGCFAFVHGYDRPEYIQAVMFGQAVAGVLPPIVQIASVLGAGEAGDARGGEEGKALKKPTLVGGPKKYEHPDAGDAGGDAVRRREEIVRGGDASNSAFSYFLAAVGVCIITLLAFSYLLARHRPTPRRQHHSKHAQPSPSPPTYTDTDADPLHTTPPTLQDTGTPPKIPLLTLLRKLIYPASAIFLTSALTMVFPIYTNLITSTHPSPQPPLLRPAAFIPLALLLWNAGDLLGRLVPLWGRASLSHRHKVLLALAVARVVFVPMYRSCNVRPPSSSSSSSSSPSPSPPPSSVTVGGVREGAMGDLFYLLAVHFPFGLTNGYIGACCMMGCAACVGEGEREAAGSFMGLCLVAGLAVGGLCAFVV